VLKVFDVLKVYTAIDKKVFKNVYKVFDVLKVYTAIDKKVFKNVYKVFKVTTKTLVWLKV
jgi:hypothetical protein